MKDAMETITPYFFPAVAMMSHVYAKQTELLIGIIASKLGTTLHTAPYLRRTPNNRQSLIIMCCRPQSPNVLYTRQCSCQGIYHSLAWHKSNYDLRAIPVML